MGITDLRGPTRAEVDQAHSEWWFHFGHRIGYRDGYEAGRTQVLTAIIDGQDDTRRRLSGLAREPAFAELERIRREPGGNAWSGREYLGGPVAVW